MTGWEAVVVYALALVGATVLLGLLSHMLYEWTRDFILWRYYRMAVAAAKREDAL